MCPFQFEPGKKMMAKALIQSLIFLAVAVMSNGYDIVSNKVSG